MSAAYRRVDREVLKQESGGESYLKTYTPVQMLFLSRLERLVALKDSYQGHSKGERWLLKAMDKVIYSTLRDCMELGVGEEAKAILRREHRAN